MGMSDARVDILWRIVEHTDVPEAAIWSNGDEHAAGHCLLGSDLMTWRRSGLLTLILPTVRHSYVQVLLSEIQKKGMGDGRALTLHIRLFLYRGLASEIRYPIFAFVD